MSRRRFVYRPDGKGGVESFEVGADYSATESRAPVATEELTYGGARTTSGTDISSRKKLREYFKATDTTHMSDYTESWKKAAAERERYSRGEFSTTERKDVRETIGRALHEARTGRRK